SSFALNAAITPRFALNVAWSLAAAWMSAFPASTTLIEGGVHVAFAFTLASQLASHLTSALQPPSSLPPVHLIGSKSPMQLPSHLTDPMAEALHDALHSPLQLPLHWAIGAVTSHVPAHDPLQVPSAWAPEPDALAEHVPSHRPAHSTPPIAV